MILEQKIYKKIVELKTKGIHRYICDEFEFDFNTIGINNIIIFGINNSIAKEFIKKQAYFKVVAIFDDFYKGDFFNGIPVLKTNHLSEYSDNLAINLTFSFNAYKFFNKLSLHNNIRMFNYYEITQYFNFISEYPYFNNMLSETLNNFDKYVNLINSFSDNLSKTIILKHLYYRLTFNNSIFLDVQDKLEMQYFDISIDKEDIFVDGGCFDGETTLLLNKIKKLRKIYCFEPDSENLKKINKNLVDYEDIKIINTGLWSEETEMYFLSTSDEISRIVEKSDKKISLNTIDNLASDATFIKLDIEGSESDALKGAYQTIKKNNPKLAISIYHKPNDLFEIIELISNIEPKYRFYIRHYSDFLFDSILYGEVK